MIRRDADSLMLIASHTGVLPGQALVNVLTRFFRCVDLTSELVSLGFCCPFDVRAYELHIPVVWFSGRIENFNLPADAFEDFAVYGRFAGSERRRIEPMLLVFWEPRRYYVPRSGAAAGADEQAKQDQRHQRDRVFGCFQHGPSRIIRSLGEHAGFDQPDYFQMRTEALISQTLTEVLT
jgi:hypothetical protein